MEQSLLHASLPASFQESASLCSVEQHINLLRYPGGKQRLIPYFIERLPTAKSLIGTYFEPFVGGASVFFTLRPRKTVLSDINRELIDLYRGIRRNSKLVWDHYRTYPSSKKGYYRVRDEEPLKRDCVARAARLLYLNRTCFKGMWRHNAEGHFNVGYGGQDRRWVISCETLEYAASALRNAKLHCSDFEAIVDQSHTGDFIFLDPPYAPFERELSHQHYWFGNFDLEQQRRLAAALNRAHGRGVRWLLINSNHRDIVKLYKGFVISALYMGVGAALGQISRNCGEMVVTNY